MRFYVLVIQYNREKEAENRTAPKAFDSLNDAKKEFYSQLAKDMGNASLAWSFIMIINSAGGVHCIERYEAETISAPEPEEV